jgi:hypothetical protein
MSTGQIDSINWLSGTSNASSITYVPHQRNICQRIICLSHTMELNQLQNVIEDLQERSVALRGFL